MQYQVGSSLPPNASSYVARQADRDFYEKLLAGEFCYVLNSRQMGKSSLRVQTMQRLQAQGIACAAIDITQIGSFEVTQDQWYATLVKILADSFQIEFKLSTWWREREFLSPLRRFSEFIEQVLLTAITQNIVIFVDEIDSVLGLSFSTDDFFAFIRACYHQRIDKPEYKRITFALLGVATPSDLIRDKKRTPFNIGQAIQLHGFYLSEAQPLAEGLAGIMNPQLVLKEVLAWTGGQPFLTQKLCQLILMSSSIPANDEAERVAQLVRSQVIEHWESQDQPEHLRTIRDRILSQRLAGRILELYKQILKHHTVVADDSPEQMELRLSGLAIKQRGSLSVSNHIYELVFNQSWVDKALSDLRPYAAALEAWVASDYQDESRLLRGQALHDAQLWATGKSLGYLDLQFLLQAERKEKETEREAIRILTKARQKANQQIRIAFFVILAMSLVAGIIWVITGSFLVDKAAKEALQKRISLGEKILVTSNTSLDKKAGIQAFAAGDFKTAINKFQSSLRRNRDDPEALIYLNNAKVGNRNNLKIVVSVPIGSNQYVAQDILRGVAQVQNEVNLRHDIHGLLGINGKQLQVEIADDRNDPELAQKLAAIFVENRQILAVVGHNATNVSIAAGTMYQNQLVMISPTSFSNILSEKATLGNRNYIFRTVPNIIPVAGNLVNYMRDSHKTHIAICSDFKSIDSNALRDSFVAQIKHNVKIIDQGCNFSNPNFNSTDVIAQAVGAGADSLLLVPFVDRINKALELARANHGRLALFGSPTLDALETLKLGKADVNGLVIAGFLDQKILTTKFNQEAQKLWGTRVNWRTVMAYDASSAIVEGLKQSNSDRDRDRLQIVLSKPDFFADGAMGKVQFQASSGERISNDCNGAECLIKVQQSGSNSDPSYDFVPLLSRSQGK